MAKSKIETVEVQGVTIRLSWAKSMTLGQFKEYYGNTFRNVMKAWELMQVEINLKSKK